ncbi:hypothetical protein KIN20_008781 [Parelaphostrongylus tenuis]|uniref:Uncharacterized protein n=1 Tax=Parelaphostrongylus tenuis TaxID=148309 RepID=A0AAD5QMW5_PARTN|nr:hypothetical protein KIN20_008781 [Parelaphostrongylus tenuis]
MVLYCDSAVSHSLATKFLCTLYLFGSLESLYRKLIQKYVSILSFQSVFEDRPLNDEELIIVFVLTQRPRFHSSHLKPFVFKKLYVATILIDRHFAVTIHLSCCL